MSIANIPRFLSVAAIWTVLALCWSVISAPAQCRKALSIVSASGAEEEREIYVVFATSTNWKDQDAPSVSSAQDVRNWAVFSPSLLQQAKAAAGDAKTVFYEAAAPDIEKIELSGARGLRLTMVKPLRKGEKYLVNVAVRNNLIAAACVGTPLAIRLETAANTDSVADSGAKPPPVKNKKLVLAQVEKRQDAEIYIEGIVEGAKKAKTGFTVDASLKRRFLFNTEEPEYFWQPFFNIKASTNEKADPDALNFGLNFENPTPLINDEFFDERLGIKRLYLSEAAKFEADKNFKNINLVGDFRIKFVSRHLGDRLFNLVPFVGLEIGKNLQSPVDAAEGKTLVRPLLGANFVSTFYVRKNENGYQKTASFEIFYERRFLLKREIALAADAGNFVGVELSRAPRDYAKSSLNYDFAKNFGFKLNYEYGSLPPLFKLVDSKFSVGLVFKGKFQRK